MEKFILLMLISITIINIINSTETGKTSEQTLLSDSSNSFSSPYTYENANVDGQKLYNAVKGIGTSEDVIINILTNRTNEQRQLIVKAYKNTYSKDLLGDLTSDTSGNFKNAVKAVVMEPHVYLAITLKNIINSLLPDYFYMNEILCTRHKEELIPIMNEYYKLANTTVVDDLNPISEGECFLQLILTEKLRNKGKTLYAFKVQDQLDLIPNANVSCSIEVNRGLMEFLAKESFEQINLVGVAYYNAYNITIQEQIQKWCQEHFLKHAYETVVRYAKSPARYYAEELYQSMIGLGTFDDKLIRIIVTRSEIDLVDIKKAYKELYNRTLESSVEAETSGDYRKLLLKIIQQAEHTGVKIKK